VFWLLDNGSLDAGRASVKRMQDGWQTAQLIQLPIHASWLNRIEL
jgi:hypothetical protein